MRGTVAETFTLSLVLMSCALTDLTEVQQAALADFKVREMTSITIKGIVYRAIKGYEEIYPFLMLEVIELPETEGGATRLVHSWNVSELPGGSAFKPVREGTRIDQIRWQGPHLEFVHIVDKRKETCSVSGIVELMPTISCRQSK